MRQRWNDGERVILAVRRRAHEMTRLSRHATPWDGSGRGHEELIRKRGASDAGRLSRSTRSGQPAGVMVAMTPGSRQVARRRLRRGLEESSEIEDGDMGDGRWAAGGGRRATGGRNSTYHCRAAPAPPGRLRCLDRAVTGARRRAQQVALLRVALGPQVDAFAHYAAVFCSIRCSTPSPPLVPEPDGFAEILARGASLRFSLSRQFLAGFAFVRHLLAV